MVSITMNKYYLCIDLGGTSIKSGIVDEYGKLTNHEIIPIENDLNQIMNVIKNLYLKSSETIKLKGICMAAPGSVDIHTKIIHGYSALPCIHNTTWIQSLENDLKIPVSVENDANCAALAEVYSGAAHDIDDMLFLVIGSGIGGAIVKNGKIHHGNHLYGGEFGYAVFQQNKDGIKTFSDLASVNSIVCCVNQNSEYQIQDGKVVFDMAKKGDLICQKAIDKFYFQLAIGIYNLQHIYDPQKVLLSGAVSSQENFLERINEKLDTILDEVKITSLKASIDRCYHGTYANLIGAFVHHKEFFK